MEEVIESIIFNTQLYKKNSITELLTHGSVMIYGDIRTHISEFTKRKLIYCKDCKKELVFIPDTPRLFNEETWNTDHHYIEDRSEIVAKKYRCSADPLHIYYFIFRITDKELVKIAEYPSVADKLDLGKYTKILDKSKLTELGQVSILESHGFNVASFLYYRRIFEYIIMKVFYENFPQLNIEEADFKLKSMKEKVEILNSHLPNYVTENKHIYSVLSEGVHELTDDECSQYLPVVKAIVLYFLDEFCENEERKLKKSEFAKELNKINSELNSP